MTGPRIGSLCAGYGGLERGLMAVVGGSVAWHCENDPHAAKVLAARYPGVANHGDLTTTDWTNVEPVDWLTAGFPCQDVSPAGKRAGITPGSRSGLWFTIAQVIARLRPAHVLIENSRGLLSARADRGVESGDEDLGAVAADAGRAVGVVLGDLADLGYDARWTVVRASDAGAPHIRARVFIHAADTDRLGLERGGCARDRWGGPADLGELASDADDNAARDRRPAECAPRRGTEPAQCCDSSCAVGRDWRTTDGRDYGPAIRRWHDLTRCVPPPTVADGRNGARRLSPRFTEWMQGLPAGWVTDVLPRNPALKCLGNGCVPAQVALAVRTLLSVDANGVAA